jgi:hypothetical protein
MEALFLYLDRLNKLGVCDMKDAGIYLECRFLIGTEEAASVLKEWSSSLEQKQKVHHL